jgi:hypothetical protein
MRKFVRLFVLALGATTILAGCKDDDDDAGLSPGYVSQGFIKGTISTESNDGTKIEDSFNFTTYRVDQSSYPSQYYLYDDGPVGITFSRGTPGDVSYASVYFTMDDVTDTEVTAYRLGLKYRGEDNEKFVDFSGAAEWANNSWYQKTATFSNLSFDKETRRAKGDVVFTGKNALTAKEYTITMSFDVVLKLYVY